MNIIQIAPVVESHSFFNTNEVRPNEHATIYGLGDDGKPYVWSLIKNERVDLDKPDEDGETSCFEQEYGWIEP